MSLYLECLCFGLVACVLSAIRWASESSLIADRTHATSIWHCALFATLLSSVSIIAFSIVISMYQGMEHGALRLVLAASY